MHWADPVARLLTADTGDLKTLALLAGSDPATFYRFQDLAGCDLRGQNLSGMDLTGTNLEKSIIDESTIIDPYFDPRKKYENEYLRIRISYGLNTLILAFSDDRGYSYTAWAYKALLSRGLEIIRNRHWSYYEELIRSNPYFIDLVDSGSKVKSIELTVQIYPFQQRLVDEFAEMESLSNPFGWVMLVGALSFVIRFNSRRDYSRIVPNSLFKSRAGALPK